MGMTHEPFICPECGREGTKAADSEVCSRCEAEYQQGMADAETYRFNRTMFGEEYAAQEELNNYLRFGDDY